MTELVALVEVGLKASKANVERVVDPWLNGPTGRR